MAIDWSADVGMILGYLAFWGVAAVAFLAEALATHRMGELLRWLRRLVRGGPDFPVLPPPYQLYCVGEKSDPARR